MHKILVKNTIYIVLPTNNVLLSSFVVWINKERPKLTTPLIDPSPVKIDLCAVFNLNVWGLTPHNSRI